MKSGLTLFRPFTISSVRIVTGSRTVVIRGLLNVRAIAAVAWLKCAAVMLAITAGREARSGKRSLARSRVRKQVSQNTAQGSQS